MSGYITCNKDKTFESDKRDTLESGPIFIRVI